MKFTLLLTGIVLLIIGLLGYSLIPNIHTIPVQTNRSVIDQKAISIDSFSLLETPRNVTITPGRQNELRINITVSLETGEPSSLQFKLFTKDRSENCMSVDQPSGCLINRSVSNATTFTLPMNASNTYYFGFDNTGSSSTKKVIYSASLFANSVQTIVTKDGSLNFLGLGLGAIGLLVALYGASRKTVIPWE